jgi:hypothetical protein
MNTYGGTNVGDTFQVSAVHRSPMPSSSPRFQAYFNGEKVDEVGAGEVALGCGKQKHELLNPCSLMRCPTVGVRLRAVFKGLLTMLF